jgi:RHH-type transcriptional regulator, rel operon repressor / antitoxin RelB
MSQSEVVTVRLAPELKAKLDALAISTKRSKSWLAAEAIAQYLEQEAWQIERIEEAVAVADSSTAQWVEWDAVDAWLESWGTEDEQPVPCV